jgi:hypothetical protein
MSENKPIDIDKKVPEKKDVPAEELGGIAGGLAPSGPEGPGMKETNIVHGKATDHIQSA